MRRNLIVRLDPASGEAKWYPVDFKGSTGPHTIAPDDKGNLWVTMVDHDQFGRFDPKTEKWKLWTLRPTDLAKSSSMAGAAIVHDMSIDSRGYMAHDGTGNIWLTMVGTNQMGTDGRVPIEMEREAGESTTRCARSGRCARPST